MVFYLGAGCQHCVEQLNLLATDGKEFEALGISIIAISTERPAGLGKSAANVKPGDFRFPIVSDKSQKVFKAYRAYDDFEQMPLHGTFLVDGNGKVRWQDISYDPFTELKFLATESRRLLRMGGSGSLTAGVGVSPHFFRQHILEKNAGLTPTPAATDRILGKSDFAASINRVKFGQ